MVELRCSAVYLLQAQDNVRLNLFKTSDGHQNPGPEVLSDPRSQSYLESVEGAQG